MKNKKGMAQFMVFLIFIVALLLFIFGVGTITGNILKNTFGKIPAWFWIVLVLFVLITFGGKKK